MDGHFAAAAAAAGGVWLGWVFVGDVRVFL